MDRTSHAEVGGPYSNEDDAHRAVEAGNFDQSAAELTVIQGASGGDSDGDEDPATKTAAFDPAAQPSTDAAPGPADPTAPEIHGDEPDAGVGGAMPATTKPSQIPGGGDPQDAMTPDPMGMMPMQPPGADMGGVVAMIAASNPDLDAPTIARVAAQVMHRLGDFSPYSMMPIIEDPLGHGSPLSPFSELLKKKRQRSSENQESEDGGQGEPDSDQSDEAAGPPSPGGRSPLPRLPLPQLSREVERAGAGAAGRALPMLLA